MPSNQHFVKRRYRSVVIKADSSFIKGLDTARNAIFTFLLAIAPPQTFLGNQPDAATRLVNPMRFHSNVNLMAIAMSSN